MNVNELTLVMKIEKLALCQKVDEERETKTMKELKTDKKNDK